MEASEDLHARLNALINAVAAQEPTFKELTAAIERQADIITGMGLVLRGLIDTLMDEEQRQMLEKHLEMTLPSMAPQSRRSIIEALLD